MNVTQEGNRERQTASGIQYTCAVVHTVHYYPCSTRRRRRHNCSSFVSHTLVYSTLSVGMEDVQQQNTRSPLPFYSTHRLEQLDDEV